MDDALQNKVYRAMRARAKWLNGVFKEQLAQGVRFTDIEIEEHPGLRTVIKVNGNEVGSWQLTWLPDPLSAGD